MTVAIEKITADHRIAEDFDYDCQVNLFRKLPSKSRRESRCPAVCPFFFLVFPVFLFVTEPYLSHGRFAQGSLTSSSSTKAAENERCHSGQFLKDGENPSRLKVLVETTPNRSFEGPRS